MPVPSARHTFLGVLTVLAGLTAVPMTASAAIFNVPMSETRPLTLSGSASDVLVGDPAIADVTVVDHHHILVHGRAFGRTNLVVMDANGRTLFSDAVVVGAGDEGRVSIFRGSAQADYSCSSHCEKISGSTGAGKSDNSNTPSGPGAAIAAPIQQALTPGQ